MKKLSDLIHGASINRPVANRASVTAIFETEEGQELKFTRSIIGSSSDHKFNGDPISSQNYLKELERLGINVNAKNFLVFQGAVESIAMKNPKERTALFEEISGRTHYFTGTCVISFSSLLSIHNLGSGALKNEYERLREEMMQAEENTQLTYQKKKTLGLERKEAKMEKEEAVKYQKLKDSLEDRQVELQLFKLYHNDRRIKECEERAASQKKEVEKIEKRKDKAEEKLKEVID